MDDFARMMSMEGVQKLGEKGGGKPKHAISRDLQTMPSSAPASAPVSKDPVYAWATGPKARTVLEVAFERIRQKPEQSWITGIRQDGRSVEMNASHGVAAIVSAANRQKLKLIVAGGHGWSAVMHPGMGIATLDEDPKGEA